MFKACASETRNMWSRLTGKIVATRNPGCPLNSRRKWFNNTRNTIILFIILRLIYRDIGVNQCDKALLIHPKKREGIKVLQQDFRAPMIIEIRYKRQSTTVQLQNRLSYITLSPIGRKSTQQLLQESLHPLWKHDSMSKPLWEESEVEKPLKLYVCRRKCCSVTQSRVNW